MSRDAINFSWLVRLRWAAVLGQLLTILVVDRVLGLEIARSALCTVIALEAASNVACALLARRSERVREWWCGVVLVLDVVILTALLHLAGGPMNPFSFLYLVEIALSAALLRPAWTWTLVAVSLACSGALFAGERGAFLGGVSHAEHMALHLRGMWVAFGTAATFIVYFLMRVRRDLARRELALADAERRVVRQERLASLATLAAGAAHELATPLGTIAVATRELERHLEGAPADPAATDDVKLIRAQVERCRSILDALAADAGHAAGELASDVSVASLVRSSMTGLRETPPISVSLDGTAERRLAIPARAVAQALRSLLKNAQEASPTEAPVDVSATMDGTAVRIVIADHGPGMPTDVLERAGEPFFTTKPAGRGMGLGIFLTRTVLERIGGELHIESTPGRGTRALVRLPAQNDRIDAGPAA